MLELLCRVWNYFFGYVLSETEWFKFDDFYNPKIVRYDTQLEAKLNYLQDTSNAITVLDLRYGSNMSYIDNNIVYLNAEVDKTNNIDYAGVQASIQYVKPIYDIFTGGKALVLSSVLNHAMYKSLGSTRGGIYYNVFLHNNKIGKSINVVISLYTGGIANKYEIRKALYDPTTKTVHISTVANCKSKYCTVIEGYTTNLTELYDRKRRFITAITADNINSILSLLKSNGIDYGDNPSDWYVTSAMIQAEVEETCGYGRIETNVKQFEISTRRLK